MVNLVQTQTRVALLAALSFAIACGGEALPSNESDAFVTAELPGRADVETCYEGEEPTAPNLCDWLSSTDAVYFGDVTEVRMTADAMVSSTDLDAEVKRARAGTSVTRSR